MRSINTVKVNIPLTSSFVPPKGWHEVYGKNSNRPNRGWLWGGTSDLCLGFYIDYGVFDPFPRQTEHKSNCDDCTCIMCQPGNILCSVPFAPRRDLIHYATTIEEAKTWIENTTNAVSQEHVETLAHHHN